MVAIGWIGGLSTNPNSYWNAFEAGQKAILEHIRKETNTFWIDGMKFVPEKIKQ